MGIKKTLLASLTSLACATAYSRAQSPILTIKYEKDQIAVLKTAPGITTRLSFPEPAVEIICGDLYDPASGKGNFVIQRSGNDVYLKPLTAKGVSNIFVKTGQKGEDVYSFDLVVGPASQAYRVVNVVNSGNGLAAIKQPKKAALSLTFPPVINVFAGAPVETLRMGSEGLRVGNMLPPPPLPVGQGQSESASVLRETGGADYRTPIKRVKPDYPEGAKREGTQGEVVVEITVDEKGKVVAARAISGHFLLKPAALNAARQWRYAPATPEDRVKQILRTVTFSFRLATN